MDPGRSVARLRLVLRALICCAVLCSVLIAGRPAHDVEAIASGGCRTISFGAGNDVGASTASVYSVALGDLDNDGDPDIVSVSGNGEDYEVIAWQSDGSPFTDLWSQNDVGASTDHILSVTLGDLDNDGDLDIVSGSYSGEDYEVIAWENDGSPFTDPWPQNDVGASADNVRSVALGDLDNDGDLDIVSGSYSGEDYEVIAWENDGSPFTDLWSQNDVGASTDNVLSVVLGDLDNDGDLDIVSASWDAEVVAWENDASPFTDPWSQNDVGASAGAVLFVALGDLDNDGDLDIVSGSDSGEDYEVIAWENDGSPFAGLWSQNDIGPSMEVRSVALGDLDNDGDLDIVSGSYYVEDYEVIAWENDGSPFTDLWSQNDVGASTDSVYWVALGDLEHDGDLDIVSASSSGEDYEVIAWENTLEPRKMRFEPTAGDLGASTANVSSSAVGDLDNDGDLDLVSGSLSGEDYEVIAWENDGSPFTALWSQNDVGASTTHVLSLALGDLDDDGDLDIVSGSGWAEDYEIIAWQNDGTPFTDLWSQSDVGASTSHVGSVALGDLDHDGDLDIVSGSQDTEDYEVIAWENDGTPFTGLWTQNDVGASTEYVMSVALGDLDNDGDLDIVSGSSSAEDYEVIAWQNDGSPFSGLWTQNDAGASADSVSSVALGDLDNDGDLDIVSGSFFFGEAKVIAWDNDASPFTGLWAQNNDVGASTSNVRSVALGDFDNDGDLDILSGSDSGEDYEVIAWQNDSSPFTGLWVQNDLGASTDSVLTVALGDLDHDGDLDILSSSASGEDYELVAWRNRTSDCYAFLPLTLKNYTP